jgi:pimeloyl-ACP methyl ester carboxylesterase
MPTLTVNDTDLHYERRGQGEPLLLVQGMTGHSLHWGEPFLCALEPDFELVLYDHRGVGRSAPYAEPFSIADLAADADALLEALGIERAHVLGISMGGMIAQELALAAPERVRTLTLGATYCGGPGAQFTDDRIVNDIAMAILSGDPQRKIRAGWDYSVSPEFANADGNFERFTEVAVVYPVPLPMIMAQMQAIIAHDTSERLGDIAAPTLVVHGTADQMLGVANGELVASLIPGARLELLEGVGHLFFWEQPEQAAKLVGEHVAAARA